MPEEKNVDDEAAAQLPAGWDDEGFDLWAELEAAGAGAAPPAGGEQEPAAPTGAEAAAATVTGATERLVKFLAARRTQEAGAVADPLGLVLALLDRPGAPTEWVPTEVLAVASGRVPTDADALTRRRVIEEFGKQLSLQTGLTSKPLPRPVDAQRRRGYRVDELREAGRRLAG